jgi:hypothetical protein
MHVAVCRGGYGASKPLPTTHSHTHSSGKMAAGEAVHIADRLFGVDEERIRTISAAKPWLAK